MPYKKSHANTMASQRRLPLKSIDYSQRRLSHFEFFLLAVFMFSVLASFLAFTLLVPAVVLALAPAELSLQELGLV